MAWTAWIDWRMSVGERGLMRSVLILTGDCGCSINDRTLRVANLATKWLVFQFDDEATIIGAWPPVRMCCSTDKILLKASSSDVLLDRQDTVEDGIVGLESFGRPKSASDIQQKEFKVARF